MIQDITSLLTPSSSHTSLLVEVVTTLCKHIRQHEYHVNLFLRCLLFFQSLCEKQEACIIQTMKTLFSSVIVYWKTALNPILDLVKKCQKFPDFPVHHGIILHQLFFILYDDIFSDLDEAMIVILLTLLNCRFYYTFIRLLILSSCIFISFFPPFDSSSSPIIQIFPRFY